MAAEPDPFVLEMRAERGDTVYTRRVTPDGRVWVRSSGGLDEDGWPAGEGEWEILGELTPQLLEGLERAIEASGFFEAPAENPPQQAVIGGAESWTAVLGDRRHTVRVAGTPVNEVEAVTRVERALEEALAAAE